jgi:hypothetical protein
MSRPEGSGGGSGPRFRCTRRWVDRSGVGGSDARRLDVGGRAPPPRSSRNGRRRSWTRRCRARGAGWWTDTSLVLATPRGEVRSIVRMTWEKSREPTPVRRSASLHARPTRRLRKRRAMRRETLQSLSVIRLREWRMDRIHASLYAPQIPPNCKTCPSALRDQACMGHTG